MSRARAALLAFFVVGGCFTLSTQALLFREHLVLSRGGELSIGLFFGTWILWVAVGATAARASARLLGWLRAHLVLACAAWALAPWLEAWLLHALRAGAGPVWELVPLGSLAGRTLVANAPASLLTGAVFTAGCGAYSDVVAGGRRGLVSAAYAAECAGGALGGGLVTLGLSLGLGAASMLCAASGAMLAAAALIAWTEKRRRSTRALGALVAASTVWAIAGGADRLGSVLDGWRWAGTLPEAELLGTEDTPYGQVAVGRLGRSDDAQLVVVQGGEIAAAYPDRAGPARVAAILMAQHPAARRVLLVAARPEGIVRALLAYPLERIVWIDPDPDATAFVHRLLPDSERGALGDPRVRTVRSDARAFFAGRSGERFDLVAILTGDPETAHANRLFTTELFRDASGLLADGGVLATRIGSEENVLGGRTRTYGATIDRTLRTVFAETIATPGKSQWLFASSAGGPITLDPRTLRERTLALERTARFAPGARFSADRFRNLWPEDRARQLREEYDAAAASSEAEINTDERPITYLHALLVRTEHTSPKLAMALDAGRHAGPWLFLLPVGVLAAGWLGYALGLRRTVRDASRRRPKAPFEAALLVGVTAATGIALHLVLLHRFQSRVGALFRDVGLANATVMAGVFLGAAATRRLLGRGAPPLVRPVALLVAAQAGLLFAAPSLVAAVASPDLTTAWSRLGFFALFVLAGATTGAAFPIAERIADPGPARTRHVEIAASRLEAADHWGGAAGACLAGTLAIPMLGTGTTCRALGAVACSLGVAMLPWAAGGRVASLGLRRRPSFPTVRLSVGLLVSAVAVVGVTAVVRARLDRLQVRFTPTELARILEGTRFEEARDPFVHYRVDPRPDGTLAAVATASAAVADDVRGYGGPLNLILDVSADGTVRDARLWQSKETPAYVDGIGAWLRSFRGHDIRRPLELRPVDATGPREAQQVDVLTGATITSKAVVEIVNRTEDALARDVLHVARETPRGAQAPSGPWTGPRVLWGAGGLAAAVAVSLWAGTWLRRLLLLANLIGAGVLLNYQFSLFHVGRLLRLELPSLAVPSVWLLVVGVLVLSLALGQAYCGVLCPFGALQEMPSLLGRTRPLPRKLDERLRYLKYVVLWASAVALLLGGGETVLGFDPLGSIWRSDRPASSLALAIGIVATSFFVFRPWCRYLCPVGAFLSLFNEVRLLGRWTRSKRYGACDLGVKGKHDVDCLQCDRCVTGVTHFATTKTRRTAFARRPRDRRDQLVAAAVVVGFAAVIGSVVSEWTGSAGPSMDGGRGEPRDVAMQELLRRTQEGRLSDHEARYYRKLGTTGAAPSAR